MKYFSDRKINNYKKSDKNVAETIYIKILYDSENCKADSQIFLMNYFFRDLCGVS